MLVMLNGRSEGIQRIVRHLGEVGLICRACKSNTSIDSTALDRYIDIESNILNCISQRNLQYI